MFDSKSKESRNKEIIRHAFNEVNNGNPQPMVEAMDENMVLTIIGSTPVSGVFRGNKEISEKIMPQIMSSFKSQPRVIIDKLIAEDDYVILIGHGEGGITLGDKEYNNTYCHVMRLKEGKIVESTEFLDTSMVIEVGIGTFS